MSLTQLASAVLENAGTLPLVTWAARLSPLDHHPHLLLADLEPERAPHHWARIRDLHPLYAPAWIRLGLDHERAGRLDAAERTLRHAATLDQTFLPHWTLTNFYYRQGRIDRFWAHARRAVAVYQGDLTGVYRLCLRVESDPLRVFERLSPAHEAARTDLMRILLAAGRFADAARVAGLAANTRVRGTAEMLMNACDSANEAGDTASAVEFWNAAVRHGWIALRPLDPARGEVLADSMFQRNPAGACFDWRIPRQDGVLWHAALPTGLRIELNGRQAAGAVLASVRIPVQPGSRYRVSWRYAAELTENSSTPVWRVNGAERAAWSRSTHGAEESVEFDAGKATLTRLELTLPSALGNTRPEGRLRLDWVAVSPAPEAPSASGHL